MALTERQKDLIRVAIADQDAADAVIAEMSRQGAAVADIADTATATSTEIGDKVNELLASMRAAGLLAE